ncbi:NAD(P)-binding domain-containing protein [Streptomyces sp. NBC_01185]|uniref:NAD(P)-binding domain-containing protein n=1 Tax=Streptomyces sp. NBC_01185 TaxID=2903764 RepID=UPI0038666F80|nr:NAD(P)-binding domain-containing protein [Streptomyces sp. NBC_01185]
MGIIGTGPIGTSLARTFSAGGHEVQVANSRGPETVEALVLELGARAVTAQDTLRQTLGVPDDLKLLFGIAFGTGDHTSPMYDINMGRIPLHQSVVTHDTQASSASSTGRSEGHARPTWGPTP